MKKIFSYVASLLTLTLALSACSKATLIPSPGSKPKTADGAANKPGVKPPAVRPAVVDKDYSVLLGTFESECAKEDYRTNPQPHVTQLYSSYKAFLWIEDGKMTEWVLRFIGETCANYSTSILMGDGSGDVWTFEGVEKGEIGGAPWKLRYTSYNGIPDSSVGTVSSEYTGFKDEERIDTIQFDGVGLHYTRY